MAKMKNYNSKCRQGCGTSKLACFADGDAGWASRLKHGWVGCLKKYTRTHTHTQLLWDPALTPLGIHPREKETYVYRKTYS